MTNKQGGTINYLIMIMYNFLCMTNILLYVGIISFKLSIFKGLLSLIPGIVDYKSPLVSNWSQKK